LSYRYQKTPWQNGRYAGTLVPETRYTPTGFSNSGANARNGQLDRKTDVSNTDSYLDDASDNGLAESIARLQDEAEALGDMPNIPNELKHRLQSLQDQITDLYEIVADDAAASFEAVEETIIARPWLSVAVAFGLGWLVSSLFRPRRY
jgi:ElaB/YqjD/DUF883 family membrane-anchored ribosome-binding protein